MEMPKAIQDAGARIVGHEELAVDGVRYVLTAHGRQRVLERCGTVCMEDLVTYLSSERTGV
jgi:hypothetical protein